MVAACGFEPLYANRATPYAVQIITANAELAHRLRQNFAAPPAQAILRVTLDEAETILSYGAGGRAVRKQLTLRVDGQFTIGKTPPQIIYQTQQRAYNVTDNELANQTAQHGARNDALDTLAEQISAQLVSHLRNSKEIPHATQSQ